VEDQIIIGVRVLQRLGMAALVVLAHSEIMRRFDGRSRFQEIGTGLLFGLGAVFAMLNPMTVIPDVLVDNRGVLIALAGPFGGWAGTAVAALIAGGYRIWLGGAGVSAGLLSIGTAASAGLICACWIRRSPEHLRLPSLALLGGGASLSALGAVVLPGGDRWSAVMSGIGLTVAATTAGVIIVGTMLARERRRMIAEAAVRESAMVDPLTGLPNRRAFHAGLARLISQAKRDGTQLALLMIDVDHFKVLNDRHGHELGDEALIALGKAIRSVLREGDLPARVGGDEFTIVLPCRSVEGARRLGEQLLAAVEASRLGANGEVSLSVSVGAAPYVPEMSTEHLIKGADEALYRAKRGGRNRVTVEPALMKAA
jgi:diguanylate cyclase